MSLDQVQPGLVSVVDRWVKVNMGGLDVRPTHVAASFLFFSEKNLKHYRILLLFFSSLVDYLCITNGDGMLKKKLMGTAGGFT